MKSLIIILLTLLAYACDPYGFGFKHNPMWILDTALQAVNNMDQETFLEISGREALCLYGNPEGVAYLKEKIDVNARDIKFKSKLLDSNFHKIPQFVGYWSYYHERYSIEVFDKQSDELLIKTIVDCDYGTEDEKDESFLNLKAKRYPKKECKLIKLVSKKFESLPISSRCEMLKVNL